VVVVVSVNLGVTFEAHRYRVVFCAVAAVALGLDVVELHLESTETVADATPPVTSD